MHCGNYQDLALVMQLYVQPQGVRLGVEYPKNH